MDIDNPRDIAHHIYMSVPDAQWHDARCDTMGDVPTVTARGYACEIGDDPNYPGIVWAILTDDDERELAEFGGWATGDTDTANREIARIIAVLSGGY